MWVVIGTLPTFHPLLLGKDVFQSFQADTARQGGSKVAEEIIFLKI